MAAADRPVRVRIAPSPTGDPHVGTAYIALFNYVFAKQQGGKFVLRIEDTDQNRFRADSEQLIYDALHWLGLSWDEGPDLGGPFAPYRQSERSAIYKQHAQLLLDQGAAYRCFCTEDRLAKLKLQQKAEKKNFGYDRHCRDLDADASNARATSESHVVRLKLPIAGPITFRDELRGDVTRDATDLDDQVLMKSDGLPTYHLANVVDDHLMEITHVVRAEEWISSTPKHVVLYQAFGWELPKFFHMSLLRNNDKDKTKVSKRKQPTSINYYKDIGIFPEAMLNFLATMGWSLGDGKTEVFSLAEMIAAFSWDKISLGGPVFNLEKLTWMNEQYLHAMSVEQLADRLIAWRLNKAALVKMLPLVQKRTKKLDEIVPQLEYFFAGDLDYAPVLADMKIESVAPADLAKALLGFVEKFEARDFTVANLTEEATAWAAANSWTTKQAFPLLRFAVTARKASPPLFETMEVLGKEITRRRIRRAAEVLTSGGKITR